MKIVIHRVSCKACGKIFSGLTLKDAEQKHKEHVDNDCKIIGFWEKVNEILGREVTWGEIRRLLGI